MLISASPVTTLGLLLTLTVDQPNPLPRFIPPNTHEEVPRSSDRSNEKPGLVITGASSALQAQLKRCGKNPLCLQLLEDSGAGFAANPDRVLVPTNPNFSNDASAREFQRQAGFKSAKVGNIWVQLQSRPLRAFLAATREARINGFTITPRGTQASRRSYADMEAQWKGRIQVGVKHWVAMGKLSVARAKKIRALSPAEQVPVLLAMEKKGLYFGKEFRKSILQSVTIPGNSQHLWGIALDIKEHDNPRVRSILAKHGWFQTLKNDPSHFTYLGFDQAKLRSLGLKQSNSQGRLVWVPDIQGDRFWASTFKDLESDINLESGKQRPQKKTTCDSENSAMRDAKAGVTAVLSNQLTRLYFARSGDRLRITSRYRGPGAQARAMYNNLQVHGPRKVLKIYKKRAAVREIVDAYHHYRQNERASTILAMTRVIENQVRRGVYISRHMLGRAVDVSLRTTKKVILGQIVRNMGGRVTREADHYHLEF